MLSLVECACCGMSLRSVVLSQFGQPVFLGSNPGREVVPRNTRLFPGFFSFIVNSLKTENSLPKLSFSAILFNKRPKSAIFCIS